MASLRWFLRRLSGPRQRVARSGTPRLERLECRINPVGFTLDSSFTPTGLINGMAAWGDYDGDGKLDLVVTGQTSPTNIPTTTIYHNDGGGAFSVDAAGPAVLVGVTHSSAAWADYDGDGKLDLVVTGKTATGAYSTNVYHNDNTATTPGKFTLAATLSPAVAYGSVSWGDYDSDGKPDILLTGKSAAGRYQTEVWHNNSTTTTTNFGIVLGTPMPGVKDGTAVWGDYDKDGRPDILLAGKKTDGSVIAQVWHNNGGGGFTQDLSAGLTGVSLASAAWGDYNGDGLLDIALVGADSAGTPTLKVYQNNGGVGGNNSFSLLPASGTASFVGVKSGSVQWGDYDADGDPDLLVTGLTSSGTPITEVQINNGTGTWTADAATGLPGVGNGWAAWGDYDGDHKLDVALLGQGSSGPVAQVWQSQASKADTPPSTPTGLTATPVSPTSVSLSWNAAGTNLSYVVRVGTATGADDVASPNASPSGVRLIAQSGPIQGNSWTLNGLKAGVKYYWSVQAVDPALNASSFAAEQTFFLVFEVNPSVITGMVHGAVAWADYDGDGKLDFIVTGGVSSGGALTGGAQLYHNDGGGVFTAVSAPFAGVLYSSAAWGDYDNDGRPDLLVTGQSSSGPVTKLYHNDGGGSFTEDATPTAAGAFTGVSHGSAAWGDYDNDGRLDFVLTGQTGTGTSTAATILYHNDGGGAFSVETAPGLTTQVTDSAAAWGDYNNDGKLDLVIIGKTSTGQASAIVYRNRGPVGAGVPTWFTPDAAAGLTGVYNGSVAWGDYDNDGRLDLVITGSTATGPVTRVYQNQNNTGPGTAGLFRLDTAFTPNPSNGSSPPDVTYSSAVWGDYTNDGNLDLLLTGATATGVSVGQIYTGTGSAGGGKFNLDPFAIVTGVYGSSAAWADYDGDGQLDLLVSGADATGAGSATVYHNVGVYPTRSLPSAPTGLTATANSPTSATLSWNPSAGGANGTPTQGLSYVLRVGTTPGGDDIVSPDADAGTGFRRVAVLGPIQPSLAGGTISYNLTNLPPGTTFYWSVQAVDGAFLGSPFASEGTFSTPAFQQDTLAVLSNVSNSAVAWGDYDGDGKPDILLTGQSNTGLVTRIYHNNGNGTFTQDTDASLTSLPQVKSGSVAWGDYDNDGRLDFVLTGKTAAGTYVTQVWRNTNGAGAFGLAATLTGVGYSSVAWGDYDNDGRLDLLVTGQSSTGPVTLIYHNNPNGTFTQDTDASLSTLPKVAFGSVAWGDYDNDGLRDFVLTGQTSTGVVSQVWHNDGNGAFSVDADPSLGSLPGLKASSVAWGDYDNDGKLDLLLAGQTGGGTYVTQVWHNDGAGKFSQDTDAALTGVKGGSVAWGDYTSDGKLDILLTGQSGTGRVSQVWTNALAASDTPPSAPTGLSAQPLSTTSVLLTWTAPAGATTPTSGLSYVVRIGTTPGGEDIVGGQANTAGVRLVPRSGPVQGTSWIVTGLKPGQKYFWSVQAVDAAFGSSAFSSDSSFTLSFALASASQPPASLTGVTSSAVAWGDYDDDGRLDLLVTGQSSTGPVTLIYHNDGNGAFGLDPAAPASLPGVKSGSVAWGDYDNDGKLDFVLTGKTAAGTYITQVWHNDGSGAFSLKATLTGVGYSSVAWGDYDDDGRLDLLVTGQSSTGPVTLIYHNDGSGAFSLDPAAPAAASLPGVKSGSVAWGDYDNDGRLDFVLTGKSSAGYVSQVWHNNGGGAFSVDAAAALTPVGYSSVAWGDYDNDGKLDLLVTGKSGPTTPVSTVYHNVNSAATPGKFTATASLTGVQSGSGSWGDYDGDGKLDILLTGLGSSGPVTQVLRNNGSGGFVVDTFAALTPVGPGTSAWGDFNGDGKLDVVLAGTSSSGPVTRVYQNALSTADTVSSAPAGLTTTVGTTTATLSWSPPSSLGTTPQAGLSYVLRVGTTPGGSDIVGPQADLASGTRLLPHAGPIQGTSWTLTGLTPGQTYYWSVEAVGAGLAGSVFATEASFTTRTSTLTATLDSAPNVLADKASANTTTVTVTYADAPGGPGVNPASFGTGNITVDHGATVTGFSVSGLTVTYTISAPGATWAATPQGVTYTIALASGPGAVMDKNGRPITPETLGTFQVDVSPPTATASPVPNIAGSQAAGTSTTVKVTYADVGSGLNLSTFGTGNVTVDHGATITDISVAGNTVTYTIAAPSSSWGTSFQGTYTISVGPAPVQDNLGNPVQPGTLGTFIVDTTPPTATLSSAPNVLADRASTSTTTVTVTYADVGAGLDPSTFGTGNISVDHGATVTGFSVSGSAVTYTLTSPGSAPWGSSFQGTYTISVGSAPVRDLLGNSVQPGALGSFVVDTVTPTASLSNALSVNAIRPGGNSTTVSVTYDPGVNPATFGTGNITVDQGATVTGFSVSGLTVTYTITAATSSWLTAPQGLYTVSLASGPGAVQDQNGNPVPAGVLGTFLVDTVGPTATITQEPPAVVSSTSATFAFTGSDNVSATDALAYQVSLDDGFTPATSPVSYSGLSEGTHTFTVQAIDEAGNVGPATSFTWTVDVTPPTVGITVTPPALTNSTSATFAFLAGDNLTPAGALVLQASLDGGDFVTTANPAVFNGLGEGAHTLTVRAIDLAGNISQEASFGWTVDTTAPTVTLTATPPNASSSRSATFAFAGNDNLTPAGALSFEASLDGGDFAAVSSPAVYSALSLGSHTFAVRAIDQAGNVGPVSTFTFAVVQPALPVVVPALGSTVGVFDPTTATWYLRNSVDAGLPDAGQFAFGYGGWKPVVGDWNGDGISTVGMFDPATATWYLRNENSAGEADAGIFQFGAPGWIPVVGDWSHSGHTGIGMFDPATGTWYLRNEAGPGAADAGVFAYGAPGWVPVAGDWDGNSADSIGVYDPTTATWYLRNENTAGLPDAGQFAYGFPGWLPVVGDWNGDGTTTVGVVDTTGVWRLRQANGPGAPDAGTFAYGLGGWAPLAGKWVAPALYAADGGAGAAALSQGDLAAAVSGALERLAALGVDGATLGKLATASYSVGDLPGTLLGQADPAANRVVLSANAAGHGWFVDPTPGSDEEFTVGAAGSPLVAVAGGPAAGKEDLLSAVLHEMGHLVGRPDISDTSGEVMDGVLPSGERHVAALDAVFRGL